MIAPTVWHVLVLSSGNPTPARGPESWHRYRAIYGEGYPWREATADEIAEAEANDAEFRSALIEEDDAIRWSKRFLAYARANGRTPADQMKHDGTMDAFHAWLDAAPQPVAEPVQQTLFT